MHNLFGNTYAVNVEINADGNHRICEQKPGNTIEEILSCIHVDSADMRQTWLEKLSRTGVSVKAGKLALQELETFLKSNNYLS